MAPTPSDPPGPPGPPGPPDPPDRRMGYGIALFIAGVCFAALQQGLAKSLVAVLPVLLVAWGRYAVSTLVLVPVALGRHGRAALSPAQPGLQVVRGLLLVGASVSFIAAIQGMPMADATALIFIYPFLVTAASPLFLGERVSAANWLAVAAGFVGVIVVVRPSMAGIDGHALLAVTAGACFGVHLLITRRLAQGTPPLVTATATSVVGAVALAPALGFVWQTLTGAQVALLIVVGLTATASQFLVILACARAPTTTLAPFGYVEIVAATAVGWLLFGDFPDARTWTGVAVIVASGLYIVRPRRRGRTASRGWWSRGESNP